MNINYSITLLFESPFKGSAQRRTRYPLTVLLFFTEYWWIWGKTLYYLRVVIFLLLLFNNKSIFRFLYVYVFSCFHVRVRFMQIFKSDVLMSKYIISNLCVSLKNFDFVAQQQLAAVCIIKTGLISMISYKKLFDFNVCLCLPQDTSWWPWRSVQNLTRFWLFSRNLVCPV